MASTFSWILYPFLTDLSTTLTSTTTLTHQVRSESPDSNLDVPFTVGLCVLIIAGVTLLVVVAGIVCYFCIARQRAKSSSRQKAKKTVATSCSPAMAMSMVAGGTSAVAANTEPDIEANTSSPSVTAPAKQRESMSFGSNGPVSEGTHRQAFHTYTSVWCNDF